MDSWLYLLFSSLFIVWFANAMIVFFEQVNAFNYLSYYLPIFFFNLYSGAWIISLNHSSYKSLAKKCYIFLQQLSSMLFGLLISFNKGKVPLARD